MKIKTSLIVLGLVLCAVPPGLASIFLEQGKIVRQMVPGESISGTVVVHNTANEPDKVKVYWEDFEYEPPYDGSKKFLPAGTSPLSCASWVKFSPQELEIPPFGRAEISYVANAPQDLAGGRYGVLFFEKADPEQDPKTGMILVSRVGTLFFMESSNRSKQAGITDIAVSAKGLSAHFENRGNVIVIPDGTYYVVDAEGVAVDRGEVPKIYVPPGTTAEYGFDFGKELDAGKYTIVLTVDLQEQDVMVKEIDFEKDAQSGVKVLGIRD